jgi:hypothetical protein
MRRASSAHNVPFILASSQAAWPSSSAGSKSTYWVSAAAVVMVRMASVGMLTFLPGLTCISACASDASLAASDQAAGLHSCGRLVACTA